MLMVIYGGDDDGDNVGGDEVDDAYNGGERVLATLQDCFIAAASSKLSIEPVDQMLARDKTQLNHDGDHDDGESPTIPVYGCPQYTI